MRKREFRGLGQNGEGKTWFCGMLTESKGSDASGGIKEGFYIANAYGCPYAYKIDDPETIGEKIGTDKKGTPAYEDDIVEYGKDKARYIIIYDEFELAYLLRRVGNPDFYLKGCMLKKSVVIGNIHDNPELLGENIE